MKDLTKADMIAEAKDRYQNLGIRCTVAEGIVHDYLPLSIEGAHEPEWICRAELFDRYLPVSEREVRRAMNECDPDYGLIGHSESLFADD